jgi:LEA14-like dessication related protein
MLQRILVALAVITLVAACSKGPRAPRPEPLQVTLVSVVPVEIGVLEQRYAVRLRVQNPRPYDVPVDGVNMNILLNGGHFARGVGRVGAVVPAFGEEVIELSAVSTTDAVIARIGDLQRASGQEFRYRIEGRFYNAAADGYNRFARSSVFRFGVYNP